MLGLKSETGKYAPIYREPLALSLNGLQNGFRFPFALVVAQYPPMFLETAQLNPSCQVIPPFRPLLFSGFSLKMLDPKKPQPQDEGLLLTDNLRQLDDMSNWCSRCRVLRISANANCLL